MNSGPMIATDFNALDNGLPRRRSSARACWASAMVARSAFSSGTKRIAAVIATPALYGRPRWSSPTVSFCGDVVIIHTPAAVTISATRRPIARPKSRPLRVIVCPAPVNREPHAASQERRHAPPADLCQAADKEHQEHESAEYRRMIEGQGQDENR